MSFLGKWNPLYLFVNNFWLCLFSALGFFWLKTDWLRIRNRNSRIGRSLSPFGVIWSTRRNTSTRRFNSRIAQLKLLANNPQLQPSEPNAMSMNWETKPPNLSWANYIFGTRGLIWGHSNHICPYHFVCI